MANDNVTSINASKPPPPSGPSRPRPTRQRKRGLVIAESGPDDGFTSLDVVNGLHGVCKALDECIVDSNHLNHDVDYACHLAMAAKVLSEIMQRRVEVL